MCQTLVRRTDGEKVQATVHNKPNAQTQVAIQVWRW
jgi:hypothetical protein